MYRQKKNIWNRCLLILIILEVFSGATIEVKSQTQESKVIINGKAQGTTYSITYFEKEGKNFSAEIEKLLQDFDMSLSTYKSNSLISKINKNEIFAVDKWFTECFNVAMQIAEKTNGAFDPTVYSLVNVWGFGPGEKKEISKKTIDSILVFTGYKKIKLSEGKIIKSDPRISLDFNAFAQGYSVDVVADFLISKGVTSFLVEIGGEVFAKGRKPDGSNWKVGIEKPIDNAIENPYQAIVKLENMALATSGNYRKFYVKDGKKVVHHIDPVTGYPTSNNLLSASVFANKAIISDAYATALLVMGTEKAIKYLSETEEIKAFLIYTDENGNYKFFQSPKLESIIQSAE